MSDGDHVTREWRFFVQDAIPKLLPALRDLILSAGEASG